MDKVTSSQSGSNNLATLSLIGDPKESFYQLGIKDKLNFQKFTNSLYDLTGSRNLIRTWIIKNLLPKSVDLFLDQKLIYGDLLKNYADGLDQNIEEIKIVQLMFELLNNSLFIQAFKKLEYYHSYSVIWNLNDDKNQTIHHFYSSDFPLSQFSSLFFHLPSMAKVWKLHLPGLPFLSFSGMNEHGLSLSIHQNYQHHFNPNGYLIFEIAFKILTECKTLDDVKSIIQHYPSMTSWKICLTFADNAMAEINVDGKDYQFHHNKNLKDQYQPIYVGSKCQDEHLHTATVHQLSKYWQCDTRSKNIEQKLKTIKNVTNRSILKRLLLPLSISDSLKASFNDFQSLSPFLNQSHIMGAQSGYIELLNTPSPALITNGIFSINDLWSHNHHPVSQFTKVSVKKSDELEDIITGYTEWHSAANNYLHDNDELCYHYLQMALSSFSGHKDENQFIFFFNVLRYKHVDNHEEYFHLIKHFQELRNKIPPYLNDHLLLILSRLEKQVGRSPSVHPQEFNYKAFAQLFNKEKYIPSNLLTYLKHITIPKLSTLDIFYVHELIFDLTKLIK